jgi:hypothetical protein
MEVLSQRKHIDRVEYEHFFQLKAEMYLAGYGFPCKKDGSLIMAKMGKQAQKNCEGLFRALNKVSPEDIKEWEAYKYACIQERHFSYIQGMRIRCDCGRELELNGDEQCECGQWYNAAGDQLVPQDQWVEPWDDD